MARKSVKKFMPTKSAEFAAGLNHRFREAIEYFGGPELFADKFFFSVDYIRQHLDEGYPCPIPVAIVIGNYVRTNGVGFMETYLRFDIRWKDLRPTSKTPEVRHYKRYIEGRGGWYRTEKHETGYVKIAQNDKQSLYEWLIWDLGKEVPKKKWG